MERLTTYISGYAHGKQGRTIALAEKSKDFCRGKFEATGIVERLAAYEDTGLTPEEINHYRWVSVAECPPADGSYLACVNGVCGIYITVLDFCKRGEDVDDFTLRGRKNIFYACDSEYGCYTVSGVTHWMPLPKPPKGE